MASSQSCFINYNLRTSIISSTIMRCSMRITLSHQIFLIYIVIDPLVPEYTISPDGSVDPGILGDRSGLIYSSIIEEWQVLEDPTCP